jgi:hypothetical protein
MEGTGYVEMLEAWRRDHVYEPTEDDANETKADPARDRGLDQTGPDAGAPVPPQPATTPPPFRPDAAQPDPSQGDAPKPETSPDAVPPDPEPIPPTTGPGTGSPSAARNPGQMRLDLTPISSRVRAGESAVDRVASTQTAAAASPAVALPPLPGRPAPRDSAVQQTAAQALPDLAMTPASAVLAQEPASAPAAPASPPGSNPSLQPGNRAAQRPSSPDLVPLTPDSFLDPEKIDQNQARPADPTSGMSPEAYAAAGARTAGLSALLAPAGIPFDQEEAAGLPKGSNPYVINPANALTLALINSRAYQTQVEQVYQTALDVTLQRWQFEPQLQVGASPSTSTRAGGVSPNPANSYLYRTNEVLGGTTGTSTLQLGTVAGVGKLFSFGSTFLVGLANQIVFNFTGSNPIQPTVTSTLPIQFAVPFLRGGGRAVTLEPLTNAERQLLYQVRSFARFRQTFMPYVLTSGQGLTTSGASQNDQSIGYLQILQQLQQVDNSRQTVAAFENLLKGFVEMARGGGSGVSQLNVDQIDSSLQNARQSLVSQLTQYRNILDQYRIQLGLPPDTPIVLDRGLTRSFRDAFDDINRWFVEEDRDPVDLPRLVDGLPALADVVIDGRSILRDGKDPHLEESILLAAERVALENRYELMNERAVLYDRWRQLAVAANALKGVFNVNLTNQYITPAGVTQPYAFTDQASQFNLVMNAELPLVRMTERNTYRNNVILFNREQRVLQQLEDQTKYAVRSDVRALLLSSVSYQIQKNQLVIQLRQKDNSQRLIFAPPESSNASGSQQITANTTALVQAQNQLLSSQNSLISVWVSYQTQRITLYRDLGIIPYDEWEAYHELFPAQRQRPRNASGNRAGQPGAAPNAAAPAA